jgi:hypothetical protein
MKAENVKVLQSYNHIGSKSMLSMGKQSGGVQERHRYHFPFDKAGEIGQSEHKSYIPFLRWRKPRCPSQLLKKA